MSSINVGYFPGCSGLGTSMEYERSTRAVCRELGIGLREIPDWNCCGSTPAHSTDSALSAALASRVFAQGENAGIGDVITPCPSCLKNLRVALEHMEDPLFSARVEALTERPLKMQHSIRSVLQVMVEDVGTERIRGRVRRSLKGLKVVPYYGCLMTRPEKVMRFDDPENPVALDRLLEALGAEVLPFPLKTDCCGGSFSIPSRKVTPRLAGRILDMAGEVGADLVVVACPLCQMNLDLRQGQIRAGGIDRVLPVPYFTQLMARAFALPEADAAFNKLVEDIEPAFACMQRRAADIEAEERKAAAAEAEKARLAAERAAKAAEKAKDAGPDGAGAKSAGAKKTKGKADAGGGDV
ncbi:MAG: CoB--CoM heterodisulfide reductase iron-sulfur subunit B family protein [Desulfovibrio sp.]|jgi:heterodisulfide reductase subunit B|nr:CoB--CoM heterodisulfide reductase iron-sulfur subunit B family protein [Desulfovibrio sp.]